MVSKEGRRVRKGGKENKEEWSVRKESKEGRRVRKEDKERE